MLFFEIDSPATGERKARGIAGLGGRDNLHLIRADLASRTLVDVLAAVEDWDNAAPSVVVAEGLTPYLAPDAGRWTGLLLWLLKASGEPWLWSIRPDVLPLFLEEVGWSCGDPDQHDENRGRRIEYHHVAFHTGHSAAG